jgi:hypothetical protein
VIATVAVYVGESHLPHGRWEPAPPSPEPVTALVGPDCYDAWFSTPTVYALVPAGRLYRLAGVDESTLAWERVDSVPLRGSDRGLYCSGGDRRPDVRSPRPPGRTVSSHWVLLEGADCGGRIRYVLLADGSVWHWMVFSCAIGEFSAFVFLIGIAAVWSLLVGVVLTLAAPPFGWPRPLTACEADPGAHYG